MWDVGDWWNQGEAYGERAHGTCRNAGCVAGRWEVSRRHDTLTFEHHALVALGFWHGN
jgi:hypothetical protein